jgi:hypothetical protein
MSLNKKSMTAIISLTDVNVSGKFFKLDRKCDMMVNLSILLNTTSSTCKLSSLAS